MNWSWKLGEVAGIKIYIHATFLLLLVWVGAAGALHSHNAYAVLEDLILLCLVFGFVVLHEMGHALAARRYGIRTRDITLFPIGGVARLDRIPRVPSQEMFVACAGPAVNLVVSGVIAVVLYLTGGFAHPEQWTAERAGLLPALLSINLILGLFNLLPAFPMDGGRILRAALATRLNYTQATELAGSIGQGFAVLLGMLGLIGNPILILIALFVWIGAAAEMANAEMNSALQDVPIRDALITEFHTVEPDEPLERATELALSSFQHDFPVTVDGALVGIAMWKGMVEAVLRGASSGPVAVAMQPASITADESESLGTVIGRLEGQPWTLIPVLRDGQIVGILTPEGVAEFLLLQGARAHRNRPRHPIQLSEDSSAKV